MQKRYNHGGGVNTTYILCVVEIQTQTYADRILAAAACKVRLVANNARF